MKNRNWTRRKEPIKNLGNRIKKEREKRGWTQEELSGKSKTITNSVLSKIESASIVDPSISVVRDIAKALGTDVDNLLKK